MDTLYRYYRAALQIKLRKPFVHIVFGARQTGKSTLIRSLLPPRATVVDLADPRERARFAAEPGLFIDVCRALPREEGGTFVFVDEAQSVPALFDAVQSLYDADKERYRFILCGSSARKLRASGANLLPGRSVRHLLHPLIDEEYETPPARAETERERLLQLPAGAEGSHFPYRPLEDRLVFGDLPGIALLGDDGDKSDILRTYATAYLEEEIRRETIVRDWGYFLRFLKVAAGGAGGIVNLAGLSRETGVSAPTIKSYYQLLEDMFVGFTVSAFSGSGRKSAISSPRFFFFDNGVRNAAAGLPLVGETVNAAPGALFEHWVAGQLARKLSYLGAGSLSYYRTADGAEVDFIVEREGMLYPIEVKWTERPSRKDARHLRAFVAEHRERCAGGFIVSRGPYVLDLDDSIIAIPWWML
jgi:predicted AAA+ superfamily ATPase